MSSLAAADGVPADRRVVVKQLGGARVATAKHGPSRKLAAGATVFIFALLCGAILIASWIKLRWKEADSWDRLSPADWESLAAEHLDPAITDTPVDVDRHDGFPPPPPPGDRWDTVR